MAAHFSGFGAPVAHPLVLADRLAQRHEIDRTRSVLLLWFGPRRFFDSRTLINGRCPFRASVVVE